MLKIKVNTSPDKKITHERIFVNIDIGGGNALSSDNHFHCKMPHRQVVMEKVKSEE